MKDALRQIRNKLGYSQQEFADKLSIEVRKLRSYEYEAKNYPNNFLKALVDRLDVNLNWLIADKGEMFIDGIDDNRESNENNVNDTKEPLYLTKKEIVKLKELLKD